MNAFLLSMLFVGTSCLPLDDRRPSSDLWSNTGREYREYKPVKISQLTRQKRTLPVIENLLMGFLGGKSGMNNGGNYGYPSNGFMPNLYGNYGMPSFGNGNYGPGYGNGYYGPPNGYYGPSNGYYGPNNPNGFYGPGIPNGFPGPGIPNGFPGPGVPNGFPGSSNPNGFVGGNSGCNRRRYG